jgi:peptide-N4-(N-acetyl-beta-glucosaminyl)asparagine amidase
MEYQYVAPPERSLNASLLIIRDFAFWFRSLFPYYYSECLHCGYSKPSNTSKKENIFLGVVCANATEKQGLAARTELFHCAHCGEVSRFARYNDVGHIVANRRGRCGEYSVLMMQLLRCLGYHHVRWIVDRDDHLWCEVGFPLVSVSNSNHIEGSNHTIEWFHVDPCEAAVNEPYIYESWGKRPSFVFAISAASVTDVTKQYSRNHSQIYSIRAAENITEMHLQSLLHRANELSVDSSQSFS